MGYVSDWTGKARWFTNASVNIGLAAGFGLNHRFVKSNPGHQFKVTDYAGNGSSYSANIGPYGISYGGDNDSWENHQFNPNKMGDQFTESGAVLDPKFILNPVTLIKPTSEGAGLMWSNTHTYLFK